MKKKLHTSFLALGILVLVITQLLAFAPALHVSAAPMTLETIKDETYKYSVYAAMHACLNRVSTGTGYYGPEDWDGPLSMDTVIVGFAGSDGGNNDGYVNCDEAGKLWMSMAGHANVSDMMSQFGFAKSSQRCSTVGTSGQQNCVETWTTNNKGTVLAGHDKIAKSKGIPTALPTGGRYTLAVSALDAKCQSSGPTITTTGNQTATTSTVTIISDSSGAITNKSYSQSSDNSLGVWPTTSGGDKSSCSYLISDVNKTAKAASATMVATRVGQTATDLSKTACEKAGATGAKLKACLADFTKWAKACIAEYYAKNPTALGGGTFDADAIATCIIAKNGGEGVRGKYNITKADLAGLVKGAMDANTPSPAGGADSTKDPCSVLPEGTQMKWLACSMLLSLDGILTALYSTIQTMLVTPNDIFQKDGFIAAVSVFRNFGLALLVIAGLIMIIAQATGSDLVDAYTVKKVLPRIGVALVGIALAMPLLRLAVIFTNDIGILIGNLMGSLGGTVAGPTASPGGNSAIGSVLAWIIGGGGAGLYLMIFLKGQGTIALVGTIVLALLVGLVVLTIRQLVIIVLILLAPLAIASSILPGTEKLWKYWRSTLLTTLAMFPIIMLFLSSGKFMASIFGTMNNGLFAVLAYFAPYFMLPFAFKLAGGLMGNIFQAVQGRASKGFEAFKGMRKKAVSTNAPEFLKGNAFKGPLKNTAFGRAVGRAGLASNAVATGELGFNAAKWGSRLSSASSRQALDSAREASEKNKYVKSVQANDDFSMAALDNWMNEDGQRAYLKSLKKGDGITQVYTDENIEEGIASIRMAQRGMTKESFENSMLLSLPGTGTAWKQKFDKNGTLISGGAGDMRAAINKVVGNDRIRGATLLAAMKGAADQAGRSDLAGASFGEDLAIMDAMYQNQATPSPQISYHDENGNVQTINTGPDDMNLGITKHYNQRVLETKGAGQLIGTLRAHAFQGIATALRDRLDGVAGVGDDRVMGEDKLTDKNFIRELGVHAGMLDAAGQSSPEKQRIIADTVFGETVNIGGKDTTYAEIIDRVRNDPNLADMAETFAETRREYGSRYAREAAEAARLAGMGDQQQQG